jgi:hypothetical protein
MTDNSELPISATDPIISGVDGDAEKKDAKMSDPTEGPPEGRELATRKLPRLRQPSGRRPLFRS